MSENVSVQAKLERTCPNLVVLYPGLEAEPYCLSQSSFKTYIDLVYNVLICFVFYKIVRISVSVKKLTRKTSYNVIIIHHEETLRLQPT